MLQRLEKLFYLFRRIVFRIRTEGVRSVCREFLFFNRHMIVVEKEVPAVYVEPETDIQFVIINMDNYKLHRHRDMLGNSGYYCKTGAECVAAFKDEKLLGFQWLTQDNSFRDLKILNIRMQPNEAYLFDLFVLPEHRGSKIPKSITDKTFSYLSRKGVTKVYGYFFGDNIKALWWHRAILRFREIGKVKIHRILFIEIVDGKVRFNM